MTTSSLVERPFDIAQFLPATCLDSTSRNNSKRLGQFFTPPRVATFMAELLATPGRIYRVLDPAAGSGILCAAVANRVSTLHQKRRIHFEVFETDTQLISALESCLTRCRAILHKSGHSMTYEIHPLDFVLTRSQQGSLFGTRKSSGSFDAVIMNPPYYKIARNSAYARALEDIVHGQPNIYTVFMALSVELLRQGGEMIAITPRSFCNGLYFRAFRRWLFQRMSLEHVHIFQSRADTFRHANVLQENVITRWCKTEPSSTVVVTSSYGQDISSRPKRCSLGRTVVMDHSRNDTIIRVPENTFDARIISFIQDLPHRLDTLSLRVSTGPVVSFRARSFLKHTIDEEGTVPLFSLNNVYPFETRWPVIRNNKPIAFAVTCESRHLLLPSRNYVLLRRFTAKEERRRLVASAFLAKTFPFPLIALENHLNYIYHSERELAENECVGLEALLNSILFDRYFRMISGNTQVNAAELRNMPLPDLSTISRIGASLPPFGNGDSNKVDIVVLDALELPAIIRRYLQERIR